MFNDIQNFDPAISLSTLHVQTISVNSFYYSSAIFNSKPFSKITAGYFLFNFSSQMNLTILISVRHFL